MGFDWLPVHTVVPTHPKSLMLELELELPRAWTHVLQAWLYLAQHIPGGVLRGSNASLVFEHAAGWTGVRGRFTAACLKVGWLDSVDGAEGGLAVHDWDEHAGAYVDKLARDAERKRKDRAEAKRIREEKAARKDASTDVQRTSKARPPDGARTSKDVQRRGEERRREEIRTTEGESAAPPAPPPVETRSEPPVAAAVLPGPGQGVDAPPDVGGHPTDVHRTSMDTHGLGVDASVPRPEKRTDARLKPLEAALVGAYAEIRGEPYVHGGAKDTTALKRVLASGADPAEVERRWRHALELGEQWPGCSTLAQLGAKWNNLGPAVRASAPRPSSPPLQRPEPTTCELCGAEGECAQGLCYGRCTALWASAIESREWSFEQRDEWIAKQRALLPAPEPAWSPIPPPRLEAVREPATKRPRAKLGGDPFAGMSGPSGKRKAVPA